MEAPPAEEKVTDNPHRNLTARNKADHGDDITRTLKLRVYPNRRQKIILRQWLGCARLVYNMVVADFRAGEFPNQKQYREELQRRKQNQWSFMTRCVPYNLLDEVLVEALHARTEVRRRNSTGGQHHNMSFRTLKDQRQSISIRHQNCVEPLKFYPRSLHIHSVLASDPNHVRHKDHHRSRRHNPNDPPKILPPFHPEHLSLNNNNWPNMDGKVTYDSTLLYERRLRKWSFCWVHGKRAVQGGENQAAFSSNVVAIDPGVVNFLTWYSPNLGYGHIGHRDINKIIRICLHLDRLISDTAAAPGCRKASYRRAQARVRKRIRNLVDEIHRKAIQFLVETFDIVVLPTFDASRMSIRRPGRRLTRKTVRGMLGWAHGRFRKSLLDKAAETPGVQIVTDFSEAYTSRTCSECGWEHPRLGGQRVFNCQKCGARVDRDANGAKGILLRAVREGRLEVGIPN